jgi:adenylate kinase
MAKNLNNARTFVFFGRSGCGKGTQAKLLLDHLKKTDPERETLYIETGARFREFMEQKNYTSKITGEIIEKGELLPAFLPIWMWTGIFVESLKGDEHIILDGLSRRPEEAPILDSAMKFYKREKPAIILIDVSRDWSKKRLEERGREDDTPEDIEKRLNWYDTNVAPTVDFFKVNPDYEFISVNGEEPVEAVHKEILKAVFK